MTVGKVMPNDWYLGRLFRFSFIHTVLPMPKFAHCVMKVFSSSTVADV